MIPAPEQSKRRGRPPKAPEDRGGIYALRLTEAQREKLERLGGAAWIRRLIDTAKNPSV